MQIDENSTEEDSGRAMTEETWLRTDDSFSVRAIVARKPPPDGGGCPPPPHRSRLNRREGDCECRHAPFAVAAESAWGRLAVTHAAAAANDDELLALLCNKRRRVGPSGRWGAVRRGGTEVARGGVPSRAIDHRHHEALSSPGPHAAAAEGRQRDGRGTVERRQRDGRVVRHVTNCPVRPLKNLGESLTPERSGEKPATSVCCATERRKLRERL
ncbi:unnamed protein product [Lampetra fluviatilis]